jgi:hypothetical protein
MAAGEAAADADRSAIRSLNLAAIPDKRDAEILQIVRSQAPKNLVVNLIITKGGFVLPEADASQPLAHIHGHVLAIVRRLSCLAISG